MTEHIPWIDHNNPNTTGSEDIDDDLFNEGPDDDADFESFNRDNDRNEKVRAWQTWLSSVANRTGLEAKRLARLTNRLRAVGKRRIPYQRPARSQYGLAPGNQQPPPPMETVFHDMESDMWSVGPPDDHGEFPHQFDYLTGRIDEAGMDALWTAYLATHDPPKVGFFGGMQLENSNTVRSGGGSGGGSDGRCLACLDFKKNPKAMWGGLAAIITTILGGSIAGYLGGTSGVAPGDVTPTSDWAQFDKSTVTVSWTAAAPAAVTNYLVSLTNISPSGSSPLPQLIYTGLLSASFVNVADGTYTVTVQTVANGIAGRASEASIAVIDPKFVDSAIPGAPSNVVVTIANTTDSVAALVVKWSAPTVPPRVGRYTALLISPPGSGTVVNTAKVVTPECSFTGVGINSYEVLVSAHNNVGDSATSKSNAVTVSAKVDLVVPPPRNLRLVPYLSQSTSKPGIAVLWDAPVDASTITAYSVSMTVGSTALDTQVTGGSTLVGYENLADGVYKATVVSENATYKSVDLSASVTLVAKNILSDALDWGLYFDPEELTKWKNANPVLVTTNETTFWVGALAAVEDKANTYGGTASYPEQLQLAQYLKTLITMPKAVPSLLVRDQLAARLAAATVPPFPLTPSAPGSEYADHLALWKAASTLADALGMGGQEPLRYKLFAIERVLQRYLTPDTAHERIYDPTVVPVTKQLDGATSDVETAQRFSFTKAGTVNGVWWYRYLEDTGPLTVTAWRGTTSVGTTTGDPAIKMGWAYLPFSSAVSVTANDKLLLGVFHPNGAYGKNVDSFTSSGRHSANITSPQSTPTEPNGMFDYSPIPVLPTKSFKDTEYYISPDFTPS